MGEYNANISLGQHTLMMFMSHNVCLLCIVSRYALEERSPFARPAKRTNAVRRGQGQYEEHLDEVEAELSMISNVESVAAAKDNIMDQNLTVAQMFRRYQGTCFFLNLHPFL